MNISKERKNIFVTWPPRKLQSPFYNNTHHTKVTVLSFLRILPKTYKKTQTKAKRKRSISNVKLIMSIVKNTVSIEIYGHPIRALVDTVAIISCVVASVLARLGIEKNELQVMGENEAVAVDDEKN